MVSVILLSRRRDNYSETKLGNGSVMGLAQNCAHFVGRSVCDFKQLALYRYEPNCANNVSVQDRCEAAAKWLKSTVAVSGGAGSCHSYIAIHGWRPPYPETTGYILKTFLRLAGTYNSSSWFDLASKTADWLLTVQDTTGGVHGYYIGHPHARLEVFNTGMVLLGWNAMYWQTKETRYLQAAIRAGDFLVGAIDETGCFSRNVGYSIPHTYNVRVAWALLQLAWLTGESRFHNAAIRNLDWTLRQQAANGFFAHNNFKPEAKALTHSIGYVLSGLIESYFITKEQAYLDATLKGANALVEQLNSVGILCAELNEDWTNHSRHICLVGLCQLAIVAMQLYSVCGDEKFLPFADALLNQVSARQQLGAPERPEFGAIPGSFPIWGRYARFQYPNWATKFYVDALLMRMRIADHVQLSGRTSDKDPLDPVIAGLAGTGASYNAVP